MITSPLLYTYSMNNNNNNNITCKLYFGCRNSQKLEHRMHSTNNKDMIRIIPFDLTRNKTHFQKLSRNTCLFTLDP